jgi:hypothetical protein
VAADAPETPNFDAFALRPPDSRRKPADESRRRILGLVFRVVPVRKGHPKIDTVEQIRGKLLRAVKIRLQGPG